MVSSQTLFNKLIAADTMLLLKGIVLSISDYQQKLIALLAQFSTAMEYERVSESESRKILQTLCYYIDKHTESCLKKNNLSWKKYSLEEYLFHNVTEQNSIVVSLELLLKSRNKIVRAHALHLLHLLSCLNERLTDLPVLQKKYSIAPPTHQTSSPSGARKKIGHPIAQATPGKTYYFSETLICGVLGASLWFLLSHYLEDLYKCLF